MLTLKQTPLAIIGIFLTCSLADGEPQRGQLIASLCVLIATILYVLACTYVNQKKYERKGEV